MLRDQYRSAASISGLPFAHLPFQNKCGMDLGKAKKRTTLDPHCARGIPRFLNCVEQFPDQRCLRLSTQLCLLFPEKPGTGSNTACPWQTFKLFPLPRYLPALECYWNVLSCVAIGFGSETVAATVVLQSVVYMAPHVTSPTAQLPRLNWCPLQEPSCESE